MSAFSRPNRRLQDTFPSSEISIARPNEVSENVNLVHEFPGREWEKVASAQATSAAALTPTATVVSATVNRGDGEWVEIFYADVSHDSVTGRDLQIRLLSPTGFNIFIARWTNMIAALTAGQLSGFEPVFGLNTLNSGGANCESHNPARPLIVPPGWALFLDGNTAPAAYTVSMALAFVVHKLADRPLFE